MTSKSTVNLICLTSLGISQLILTSCGEAQKEERFNIVYIMTDDHTAQMMSCYDNRYVETL